MIVKDKHGIRKAVDEVAQLFPFGDLMTIDAKKSTATLIAEVSKVVGDVANPRLLDIACGAMNITAMFAKCGFDCFAIDDLMVPWHLLGDNRRIIKDFASSMGIKFNIQDLADPIPFDKESFDIVLLNSIIEHLHESPRDLLNEAFGFLKTGGIVVVTMPNSVNLRKRLSVLFGKTNFPPIQDLYHSLGVWRGHVREYTLSETNYILEQTGGHVILSKGYHRSVYTKISSGILRWVYIALAGVLPTLRDSVMVIARKPSGWTPAVKKNGISKIERSILS